MHGGDLEAVSREYGIPGGLLLDFSASINPVGPPSRVTARLIREAGDQRLLVRYPDPLYSELRAALAGHLGVAPECLAIGNGSAALIGPVFRTCAPGTCLIAVPAFGEQCRALRAAGWGIERFPLQTADGFRIDVDGVCETIDARRPALCLLTNPHNPSGVLTALPDLERVVVTAERAGTRLIVDEAFIDYSPAESLTIRATRSERLVVLRSLTKFYGMPALRVGYAVSTPALAAQIGDQLPPWAVTTLAASAGAEALADSDYACRTLAVVASERQWLLHEFAEFDGLARSGMHAHPSAANFLLLRLPDGGPDSTTLRTRLIREHHIVVRDCRSFEGLEDGRYIRVAVRSHDDNARLLRALRDVLAADD
jgi:threonine-phosphate decarboxylase